MPVEHVRSKHEAQLEIIASRRYRNPVLHWVAFVLSVVSFVLLMVWVTGTRGPVNVLWVEVDIALGVASAIEFFTRSGFHWKPITYVATHFYDFVAIVPALALVNQGYPLEGPWVWLILIARGARGIDRLFGDGFVQRNAFAVVEGFEEEITDRVLMHVVTRIQADLARGRFGEAVAKALERNKDSVLQRIKAEHPKEGLVATVAKATGLDAALERAEESTYEAIISIINSPEVDKAISDALDAAFLNAREEIGEHTWRQHLGFRRKFFQPEDEKNHQS